MQTQTKTLNGHSFFLRRWGTKGAPKILLLHGFPEFSGAWAEFAPLLADDFELIAPDQRGFGQSYAPDGAQHYKISDLIADMAALIQSEGAPIIVMGHDWGAAVAYGLAMFRPDLVSHLIVANGVHPAPFQTALAQGGAQSKASQYMETLRDPSSHERLAANDFAGLMALFSANMDLSWLSGARLETYKRAWSHGGGRLETMIHWYRASPMRIAKPNQPLEVPPMPTEKLQVRCPHLLLWAQGDTALLPQSTESLETYVQDLTRVDIPDADHWLIHQQPQKIAQHLRDWLAQK